MELRGYVFFFVFLYPFEFQILWRTWCCVHKGEEGLRVIVEERMERINLLCRYRTDTCSGDCTWRFWEGRDMRCRLSIED